jgi:probable F420-dependent oxidoreductase
LGLGSASEGPILKADSRCPWSRPAARMSEYVEAMRAIWDAWQNGTSLNFQGEFYAHKLMTPMFDPGPLPGGPPRIFVAGLGVSMIRNIAEVADGPLSSRLTTRRYVQEVILPLVDSGLAVASRDRGTFEVKYGPFVVTGTNEVEMSDSATEVRRRIAFYASTPAYRPVLELHGWGELQSDLEVLARRGEWAVMGDQIDDEILEAFAVVAPLDELPEAFGRWVAGLADRTNFSVPSRVQPDESASYVQRVRLAAR